MASLPLPSPFVTGAGVSRSQPFGKNSWRLPRQPRLRAPYRRCTTLHPWEISPADEASGDGASLILGSSELVGSMATKDAGEAPFLEEGSQLPKKHQPLKWPFWLLGPLVLLLTGMAPTLWLPLSSVFLGANIAGVLALVGLDCIFNMGATLFLLMADACARPEGSSLTFSCRVPLGYKLWNMAASVVGFIAPVAMLLASHGGSLQPQLPLVSFAVLLGPYLLLLSTQMLTETLTWHWKSPVWLLTPVVYEAYRVLQLMRGLRLAAEVGAPAWAVDAIRGSSLGGCWFLGFS
ncbi:unnamed protein product [Spirodela intermedia]|uniref:Uncharacterized protein n=1 Tax=Spirodela intermedia TaxID=51605 RepID=A0A7I8IEB9_SPIIN|nr:unnamed protein product [Spirodela intermedia]CAA6656136.1 unnamed protein product [Spirodela intermedia]